MGDSKAVKTTRRMLVLSLAVFAAFGASAAAADAKPQITSGQAVQAANDKLEARVERSGNVVSFGIDGCVRRARSVFACRATVVRHRGDQAIDCSLEYRVKRQRARLKTKLIRKQCSTRSLDDGSGDDGGWLPKWLNPKNPFQEGSGPKYCPGYKAADNWDAVPDIVGKSYAEAISIAAEHDCVLRMTRIDGIPQVVTMDLRYNRLNVEVEGPEQLITAIDSVA